MNTMLKVLFAGALSFGLSGCPIGDDNNDRDLIPETTHNISGNYRAI